MLTPVVSLSELRQASQLDRAPIHSGPKSHIDRLYGLK